MNIYVDNLSSGVEEKDLRKIFEQYGKVGFIRVPRYKGGRPKGYAFVEMPLTIEALSAIEGLKGKPFKGRNLKIAGPYSYH